MKTTSRFRVQPARLKSLLKEILDLYSPSGKEEEILEFTDSYLQQTGIPVIKQKVDQHRYNLLVVPGDPKKMSLCYIGHLDTVAAYDLAEFGFEQRNDTIHGLGAADMKAGCAAMIEMFHVLVERGIISPAVGLALVVGEEEDNSGARALINEYRFPWAVIGEPTNLVPCTGHYTYLEALLQTRGRRAHPAVPEQGQNAIVGMLKLLLDVTEFATSKSGELVYNIRDLSVLPLGFFVPEICEAWLDLHLPPNYDVEELKTTLQKLVKNSSAKTRQIEAVLRFEETQAGYKIDPESPFVKKLKRVYDNLSLKWEPADFRSHSDANILWTSGIAPVILGPGRLEEAHSPEESVSFKQTVDASQIYLDLALAIASSNE